jgi:hypothetical protein
MFGHFESGVMAATTWPAFIISSGARPAFFGVGNSSTAAFERVHVLGLQQIEQFPELFGVLVELWCPRVDLPSVEVFRSSFAGCDLR